MEDVRCIDRFPAGVVTPPPSKSLSHRAVICRSLAARFGGSGGCLDNVGQSQDIEATTQGMAVLGKPEPRHVHCRESGSTLRFLLPIAALDGRETRFSGSGRLLERPLDSYEHVFRHSGLTLRRDSEGILLSGQLRGGSYALEGHVSSQFVSGLLMALPLCQEDSELRLTTALESRQYVDLTLDVMNHYGVTVDREDWGYRIPGGQHYRAADYHVEADFSQAAFFLAAAALGQNVSLHGLHLQSHQGDRAILDILSEMGATVSTENDITSVHSCELRSITYDIRHIPDLAPPIAALCAYAEGESLLEGAGRLRIKECDRLSAIATELRALGAEVSAGEDWLRIRGQKTLRGGRADAWNDHRIAMMTAVAAIGCEHPVYLSGWRSVEKSYPHFWEDFSKVPKA